MHVAMPGDKHLFLWTKSISLCVLRNKLQAWAAMLCQQKRMKNTTEEESQENGISEGNVNFSAKLQKLWLLN